MLGKLLWCMVAGRMKLPREYHRQDRYNLEVIFPEERDIARINSILERSVVERPERCLPSANELLTLVNKTLVAIERHSPYRDSSGNLMIPCQVCGNGFYIDRTPSEGAVTLQQSDSAGRNVNTIRVRYLVCNVCTHNALFAPNYPEEAAAKNWAAWAPPKKIARRKLNRFRDCPRDFMALRRARCS